MGEVSNDVERQEYLDPSMVLWPGFTMHGLVRWRAGVEATQEEYELCRAILVTASCRTNNEHEHGIDFRYAMRAYLPQDELAWRRHFTNQGFADLNSTIGKTLLSLEEYERAEVFLGIAYVQQGVVSGESDPATVHTTVELAVSNFMIRETSFYCDVAESQRFIDLFQQRLFQGLPGGRARLVAALYHYDRTREPEVVHESSADLAMAVGSKARCEASVELSETARESNQTVVSQQEEELEACRKLLGDDLRDVVGLMSNLARWHSRMRVFEKAEGYLGDLEVHAQRTLGTEHPNTLQVAERVAFCKLGLGEFATAIQSMKGLTRASRRALGGDDPRTRSRKAHLEAFERWDRVVQLVKPGTDISPSAENIAWVSEMNLAMSKEGYPEKDIAWLCKANLQIYKEMVRFYMYLNEKQYAILEALLNSLRDLDRPRHVFRFLMDQAPGW
jgi:hypothetical protein